MKTVEIGPTPKDTILRDGTAQLYRFRRPAAASVAAGSAGAEGSDDERIPQAAPPGELPLLLVPSLINRWYVMDLRPGVSLAGALVEGGLDTFLLDWGIPRDEDRHLSWEHVLERLGRAVRGVLRETGAPKVGILGYCMGGTLSGIYTALHPDHIAALVNLAGPFDFAEGGPLSEMVDPRWFDADHVADAGNVHPRQMQAGFVALRPTNEISKWVNLLHTAHIPEKRVAFRALDTWASDNIPFPAEAYRTYIRELYQENQLVRKEHRVRGRRVDLSDIHCPVLTIAAERDTICPVSAASALNAHVGSEDEELLLVPGGHVGAVVGSRAPTALYPAIADWLRRRLCN